MALTDTAIKSLKPKEKQYKKFDGNGLYILIKPTGSKLWQKNYNYNGKRKTISFGKYPVVSLKDARDKLQEVLKQLSNGIDPMLERNRNKLVNSEKTFNTLEAVALMWYEVKRHSVSRAQAKQSWNRLNTHILTKLGNFPLADINSPIVIEVLQTLKEQEKYEMIGRVLQILTEVMIFARNRGVITQNNIEGIKKAFPSQNRNKHMSTISPEELPELMQVLHKTGNITNLTRYLALFQLHTMVLPSESAKAQWKEIDFENKKWTIPAERMKIKKEHVVPLSSQVIILLSELEKLTGDNEYLFLVLAVTEFCIYIQKP